MKTWKRIRWVWFWSGIAAIVLFLIYTGRFNPHGIFAFMAPAEDDMEDMNSVTSLVNGLT
jgi:hypothetical protein